uniref:F-box domain-containing protein n=1 Tax=Fagus sylvatica TaxID=28930 RepID=A0A2N9GG53_FAGSY
MSDNLPQLSKSITEDLHTESMWDWDFLPPEILIQSLSLLPIKTLITCISVSKTWKSLIQNPTFISTHLNHSKNNHLFLFRLCSKQLSEATRCNTRAPAEKELYKLHWDNNNNNEDFKEHTRFDFPFHGKSINPIFNVVGTCNGLVCLADDILIYAYNFIIWNPCLRKFIKLPRPNVTFDIHGSYDATTGFGFDDKTNDYKVVRFVTPHYKGEMDSLATGEWRMVSALAPIGVTHGQEPPTFLNGLCIWMLQLVSQDLESKKIKNLGMTGYGYTFAGSYVESLVLLDKPDRAVTY